MRKKDFLKKICLFFCIISIPFFSKFSLDLIYSASSVTCLESKPEDTYRFGDALAITNDYIAVGDSKANRVSIYSYDSAKKRWFREREIYPPKGSIIEQTGSGFGKYLAFHKNQLIVGAYNDLIPNYFGNRESQDKYIRHGSIYSILLEQKHQNSLKKINLPENFKLTGYSLTIFKDKIAVGATTGAKPGEKPGQVLVINPNTLEVENIIEAPIWQDIREDFGFSISGSNESLVIGSVGIPTVGGFYLTNKQGRLVETVSISEIIPDNQRKGLRHPIILGNDFVALGNNGWQTSIFKKLSNGWSEIYSVNFNGSFSSVDSQLLVSSGRYPFDRGSSKTSPNHLLINIKEDKAFIKSKIRWQWGIYYDDSKAKGAINSKYLLLSRKGKVVLLKRKNLPRDYVINKFFCGDK